MIATPLPHVRRVDRLNRRVYLSALRIPLFIAAVLGAGACAAATQQVATPADPAAALRLVEATAPESRVHVVFTWSMTDRDARFQGQGALRLDNRYRGRVDLFGPRGETLAAAIVEDDVLRVAPSQAASLLPPPALLWAALGVFRQPADAPLTASGTDGGQAVMEYGSGRTRWTFRFDGEELRHAEWTDGTGRRTVELSGSAGHGLPARSSFRDWTEFRELTLTVTNVEESAAFEPDVWILPGER